MKKHILASLVLVLVAGCEPPPVQPDQTKQVAKVDRYADFTSTVITDWKLPQGRWEKREKVSVLLTLTPSRAGAYYVEAADQGEKVLVSEGQLSELSPSSQPSTQPTGKPIQFGKIDQFVVIYSDGKDIFRTVVKTD